ncbi:MAG TPA: phosphotransferase [Bordetella sp.]
MTTRSNAATSEQALFAADPPKLSTAEARSLAEQVYGLAAQVQLLSSERDQNFQLRLDDGRAFVLKVTHPAEDPAVTDFQTQAQLHVMRADGALPVPHLFPSRDGAYVHWHEGPDGTRRAVRLMAFLEGVPLYKAARSAGQGAAIGHALASFDLALADFDHPMAGHELLWDLQHADRLADLLARIGEADRRALAERHMERFRSRVRPALAGLRRQVIHNDLNPYNMMVHPRDPARVAAILDFGDMVRAPLAQDLAVACAYRLEDEGELLSQATPLVASYHRALPLAETEIALLPDLIAARLLITVAITGWRAEQHPENRTYILRNNGLAWSGLARLDALPLSQVQDVLFNACRTTLENPA